MGRKKLDNKKCNYTLRISPELKEVIREVSEKRNMKDAQVLTKCIVESYSIYDLKNNLDSVNLF